MVLSPLVGSGWILLGGGELVDVVFVGGGGKGGFERGGLRKREGVEKRVALNSE